MLLPIVIGAFHLVSLSQESEPVCFEPFPRLYLSNENLSATDLNQQARAFRLEVGKTQEAVGIVYAYGGRTTRIKEVSDTIELLEGIFGREKTNRRIWVWSGGYRERATVDFFIVPLKCSSRPLPQPDLEADQVDFAEFPRAKTRSVEMTEFYAMLVTNSSPECPPAATAVRACTEGKEVEVFVIVDQKGLVVFSRAYRTVHPLMRSAAETHAKKLTFKPAGNVPDPSFRSGVLTITFSEGGNTVQ